MCSKIITEKNVVYEWDDISYKLGMEKGPWQQPTRTKYESSLYECWRTQHAWGIWMEVTEDTYIFVVDYTLKSKVETVPWSWEDRPHENLEDPHPQWQCARSLLLLFLTLKFSFACSLLFIYSHIYYSSSPSTQIQVHTYTCSFGWSIEDLVVNLSYTVSFFIWVLFGSWENWWSQHILDWWYDCSWLIISWVDFLLTIFFFLKNKRNGIHMISVFHFCYVLIVSFHLLLIPNQ